MKNLTSAPNMRHLLKSTGYMPSTTHDSSVFKLIVVVKAPVPAQPHGLEKRLIQAAGPTRQPAKSQAQILKDQISTGHRI